MTACHVLLDDRNATALRPTSRLYTGLVSEHRCTDPSQLDAMWTKADADLRAGLHAVLLGDYEWGAKLLRAGHEALPANDASSLRVLMFSDCRKLSRDEADAWLQAQDDGAASSPSSPSPAGVMALRASVDHAAFTRAIDRIHEAIRAGETYQVNYTYRLHGEAYGTPVGLYRRLRARQPVAFGAFIALPEGGHVLSCSPELFVQHQSGLLTARPMKGTASRIAAPEGDSETARMLSIDIKNRAENLMIVDLLRNDIGRVARIGSVKVPALFAIEPYSTVFQMTSTIQAELLPEVDVPTLLRALFPCGSITGAPKHHTMQLIADFESEPRGIYTGAIGWMDAPQGDARCGDFCLSVAIRTLTLSPERAGTRAATLGIGAGIVLDSRADDEFDECRLKARFLTKLDPGFALFETMLATHEAGVQRLDLHLARLGRSAAVLGFMLDEAAVRAALQGEIERAPATTPLRLRLALFHDGRIELRSVPLVTLVTLAEGGVGLLIAEQRLPDANPLAAHKTTHRGPYDAAVHAAENAGGFDSLFFTRDGRLAEGARSNVFLQLDGCWFTPPVADGALPGVMRGVLLADPTWHAEERSLRLEDLLRAERIVVCNALRGALDAGLIGSTDAASNLAPTTP